MNALSNLGRDGIRRFYKSRSRSVITITWPTAV
jgi:hypothetical protein